MTDACVVIRADADSTIGSGHIMRCIAVAEGLAPQNVDVVFATKPLPARIRERLDRHGLRVREGISARQGSLEDAVATIAIAAEEGCRRILIDGMKFDDEYASRLVGGGLSVAAIDDYATAPRKFCRLTINQNVYAAGLSGDANFLGGLDYALLRGDVLRSDAEPSLSPSQSILVSMGGADPDRLTAVFAEAARCASEGRFMVLAIVGGANPDASELATRTCGEGIDFKCDVPSLAPYLSVSSLAIVAAGGTMWEAMHWGVDMIAVFRDEAQERSVNWLLENGLLAGAIDARTLRAGDLVPFISAALHDAARASRAAKARKMVDGRGAHRVAARLLAM